MEVQATPLPNNIIVVSHKMPGSAAAVGAFVNIGSRHERLEENGVAHFLEHMAFKGTERRSAFDISHEIEVLGAESNAMTGHCRTAYYVKGLAEHVSTAVDIIGDALTNSKFDQADIDLESGVILQEISQYEDDLSSTMGDMLSSVAYPDQPVGRKILGTKEFVSTAKSQNFRDFIGLNYSGETMIVVGTGAIEHDSLVESVSKSFAKVPATSNRTPIIPATYGGGIGIDRSKPFSQAAIGILFPSVPYRDNARYANMLLALAFGNGMSSPLFTEIREKRGLVYHTSAFSSFESDHGDVGFYGLLTPENLNEFIKVGCAEFAKLTETISERDLLRAKNTMLVQIAFMQEQAISMMHYIGSKTWQVGYVPDPEDVRRSIQNVTVDDLREAAKRLLTGKPSIALVGPVPDADYEGMVTAALGGL